jgi:hypothetical protein
MYSNCHGLIFVSVFHAVLSNGFSIYILYAFLFSSFLNSTPLTAGYLHTTTFLSFFKKRNEKVISSGNASDFYFEVAGSKLDQYTGHPEGIFVTFINGYQQML